MYMYLYCCVFLFYHGRIPSILIQDDFNDFVRTKAKKKQGEEDDDDDDGTAIIIDTNEIYFSRFGCHKI